MTRTRTLGAVALAATLLLAGACSDDDEPEATTGSSETTTAADEETTTAADSELGSILVDGQGNTLYLFTSDTQGEPTTCTGGCAGAWPALIGTVTAGEGVDEGLIGTVTNDDGTEQATYNGWPLYYYAQDAAPGDTAGQGVGGVWWVIDAEGNAIEG
jgi:predicted lipoprotein with Yx(FWY)xxD motif